MTQNYTRSGYTLTFNTDEAGNIRLDLNSFYYPDTFIDPRGRLSILTRYALDTLMELYDKLGISAALSLPDKKDMSDDVFNYANFCASIGFPDLQDNGIFERAVRLAWDMFEIYVMEE